jgi:NAD(P)-dependent dehydrogenase (short-subunit alcohol dehydrogenase family)
MKKMSDSSTKRVALVTGGAQGIGKAITERFLRDGMNVLIADCDEEASQEAMTELQQLGNVVDAVCDVSNEQDVGRAVSSAIEHFRRLDILVCNAGIGYPGVPVTDLTLEQWRRVIDVNLTGCFLCAKHGAEHLRKTGGSIVNIASTRAIQSEANTEPYSASKGGIVALTHALGLSLGPQIRVNCISPGWIETRQWKKERKRSTPQLRAEDHAQHPAGRVGKPEDVASLVTYLASEEAGFITGQNFIVDGGMARKMIYIE